MRKDNWLSYFVYAVILICYIFFSNEMLVYANKQSERTYNTLPVMLWSIAIYVVLGLLIGLDKFLLETRKEGHWKVNLPKILFLGIPSLYFSIGMFIYYCPIDFIRQILVYPISIFLKFNFNFIGVFQMILGFTIITSFIKVKE